MHHSHCRLPHLVLRGDTSALLHFSTLLQNGLSLKAEPGMSISSFLENLPGFTEEYILREVQTIFLNGTATDDIDAPLPGPSATLAITTAMPGLAGAIFRKGSPHAPLRSVTSQAAGGPSPSPVAVTLKLFGSIAREKGPLLLQNGVVIKGRDLTSFLKYRPSLLGRIITAHMDGREISRNAMLSEIAADKPIHLSVLI